MKVKFTKLAALLLAGAALFATGCTDYEVDIQKVDEKVDALANGRVATLESQLAALTATLQSDYETIANHNKDVQAINKTITDLDAALRALIDTKADKAAFEDFKTKAQTAIDALKALTAGFPEGSTIKKYIDDLNASMDSRVVALENMLAGDWKGKTVLETIAALETEFRTALGVLDGRLKAAEASIKTLEEKTIPDIKKQISALEALTAGDWKDANGDPVTIKQYVDAVKETLRILSENYAALVDGLDGKSIKEYVEGKLDDYVLKTTFQALADVVGTEAELKEFEGTIISNINALNALTAGDWGGKTIKDYVDNEVNKLQAKLSEITNEAGTGRLDVLEKDFAALKQKVDKMYDQIKFAYDYETAMGYPAGSGLQGYIDDGDAEVFNAAKKYTDEKIKLLKEWVADEIKLLYSFIQDLQKRIQSIVYVPDYDDLKITSNMSAVTLPGVEEVLYVDQPTQVTYEILPAQYASKIADKFAEYLVFDVKPVNTRADEEAAEAVPAFQILKAEYEEDVNTTGLVTFTVLPVNIASAQFAANGIKPEFIYTATIMPFIGALGDSYVTEDGDEALNLFGDMLWPAFNREDIEAFRARTAFAASLRLKKEEKNDGYDMYYNDDVYMEYNEVASTYNVLYPDVTSEIEVPGDAYKKLEDGTIRPFTEDEVHLKLPYNSAETKVILDQAVPAYLITDAGEETKAMTYEQATAAGYVVPQYAIQFPAEYDFVDNNGNQREKNYIVDDASYVTVNMALSEPASERKLEIGNQVVATYTFKAVGVDLPSFVDEGDVTITKELASVAVSANAVWTWNWNKNATEQQAADLGDAKIDHNRYYEEGGADTLYVRLAWPVSIDDMSQLAGVELKDFAGLTPEDPVIIKVADRPLPDADGNVAELTDADFAALGDDDTFKIENVAIKDNKLSADFVGFEWNKVYQITAVYELQYATVTVNGTFTTYDRNREPVTLKLYDHVFEINKFDEETGFGYIAGANGDPGYYYWKTESMNEEIFKVFQQKGVIDVNPGEDIRTGFKDFANVDEFFENELQNKTQTYEEDGVKIAGTANKYVVIKKVTDIYGETRSNNKQISAKDLKAMNSGVVSDKDKYTFLGNVLYRNITTYIGEKVVIPFRFDYKVPAYDFLRQANYTFEDGAKWYTMASPKYDENKGKLQKYDVQYMNVPALSFNVIDENNRFFNYKDPTVDPDDPTFFREDSLVINFFYTDKAMYETPIEKQSKVEGSLEKYGDLWFTPTTAPAGAVAAVAPQFDTTVFYYRSTRDAIQMQGKLEITCDGVRFEIPTSFKGNNYLSGHDYSQFELRAWKPFYVPTYTQTIYIDLDEHTTYTAHSLEGLQFFDGRQVAASSPVDAIEDPFVEGTYSIEDFNSGTKSYFRPMLGFNADPQTGEKVYGWIIGDADSKNGYYPGVSSWTAYDLQIKDFEFDDRSGVPADLDAMLTVTKLNDWDYLVTVDYTSETEFQGLAEVDFSYVFQTPWQVFTDPFTVKVIIRGLDQQ